MNQGLGCYYDEETSIFPLQEGYYTGHFPQPMPTRAGARGRDTRRELKEIIEQPFDARRMRNLPEDTCDLAILAGTEALLIKGYPVTPYLELAKTGDWRYPVEKPCGAHSCWGSVDLGRAD
ncbi:MAG: hypothetical protein R3F19_33185 [Verrucomicrobiales bacterium]